MALSSRFLREGSEGAMGSCASRLVPLVLLCVIDREENADSGPPRKRLQRRELGYRARYLTFSCFQCLPLFGTVALRRVFVDGLRESYEAGGFDLLAWVVMPEHVHLMVVPWQDEEWGPIAQSLKTSVAKRILFRWRKLNAPILARLRDAQGDLHFWQQGGGFDRNVRDDGELEREIRYIHRNPVEEGLVTTARECAWSSVRYWIARHEMKLEMLPMAGDPYAPPPCPPSTGPEDLVCDWPPGHWRAWAAWTGFE